MVDVESENIGITGAGNGRGVGILLKDGGMIEAKGKSGAITDIKDYIKVYENGGFVKINQSVTYAQVTSFDEKVEYKNGNIVYARNGNIVEDEWVMLAPYYPIEVGGIRLHKYRVYLSPNNYPSIIKSGGVIYNAKEHTLTLAGATIESPNRPMDYNGIFSNHPSKCLTIKCKGINTITATKKSGIYIEDIGSPVIMGEGWNSNSSLEIYPSTSAFFPGVGIFDYSKSSVGDHMLIKNIDLKISSIFSCISTRTQNKKVILRNLNATLSTSSSRLIGGFETLAIENAYIASPLGAVVEGGTIKLNGEPLAGTTCEIKRGDLPFYPITIDPDIEHGKVTLSHSGSVAYGTEVTVTVTPNEGYKLSELTANGADITATKKFIVQAATTVSATFVKQIFAVTAKTPQNGKITIKGYSDLKKVPYGTELTVEVAPNQGYELTKLTANGADITATRKFVVKKATTVEATFTKQTFAVTAKAPQNGKITIKGYADLKKVPYGTELTVEVTPNAGYKLAKLTANGADITAAKKFVVKAATTVEATFTKQTFAVTAKAPQNGKITIKGCADLKKVPYGTELTVEVTPNEGYKLEKLTANGADITATKKFVVEGATMVEAAFALQTFAVTVTAPQNGKIAIKGYSDLNNVPYGTELTVEVTPDEGYKLEKLTANGEDITATKKFFVERETTVKATFKKDTALEDVASTGVLLYPNPAEETTTLSGVEPGAMVQVFSIDGVEVLRTLANEAGVACLDLAGVAAGKYLVKSGETTMVLLVTK